MTAAPARFTLHPHPATPCPVVRALSVDVAWRDATTLQLVYRLGADLARLCIPAPSPLPAAKDGLWQHTCFEAFIGLPDAPGYHEFNASPSGDYAAYVFRSERERVMDALLPAPQVSCQTDGEGLQLVLEIPQAALPQGEHLQLGISAVIETAQGECSYFALAHPKPAPDFHARAGWTAQLSL